MQFVQHYIGKRHGILEKYVSEELQNRENDPDFMEVAVLLANISKKNEPLEFLKKEIIDESVDEIKDVDQEVQNSSSKLLFSEESDEKINNEMNEILEDFRENEDQEMTSILSDSENDQNEKNSESSESKEHFSSEKNDKIIENESHNAGVDKIDFESMPNSKIFTPEKVETSNNQITKKDEPIVDTDSPLRKLKPKLKKNSNSNDIEDIKSASDDFSSMKSAASIKREKNFGESLICEICSLEFSEEKYSGHKGNLMRDLRFHYYAKHFKNSIDEELKGSKSQCPFENCLYR